MSHPNNSCNFYQEKRYVKEDFYDPEPFKEGCTDECRQNFLKVYAFIRDTADMFITLFKAIKLDKDGKIPKFSMLEVADYYEGTDHYIYGVNKNIQDLFDIDLLEIDIPFLKKRKDIPKREKEKEEKENDGSKGENNVAVEEIKKNE